jgi:hypothetical protein
MSDTSCPPLIVNSIGFAVSVYPRSRTHQVGPWCTGSCTLAVHLAAPPAIDARPYPHPQPAEQVTAQDSCHAHPIRTKATPCLMYEAIRVARDRTFVTAHTIDRSTRPPSSGNPGMMLNSPSSRLARAR